MLAPSTVYQVFTKSSKSPPFIECESYPARQRHSLISFRWDITTKIANERESGVKIKEWEEGISFGAEGFMEGVSVDMDGMYIRL